MGEEMGEKTRPTDRTKKVNVRIDTHKGGWRLRWTHETRRELSIRGSTPFAEQVAERLKTIIENDLVTSQYDASLNRYRDLIAQLTRTLQEGQQATTAPIGGTALVNKVQYTPFDVLTEFARYTAIKGHVGTLPTYYRHTQKMLEKWVPFDLEDVPRLLGGMGYAPNTFNPRRNCLSRFFAWCVKKGKINDNPLSEVSNKRSGMEKEKRKPFTDSEAARIVEAFRTNLHCQSKTWPNTQYYPFVSFMFHVGTRNAEAIGLLVKDVDFEKGQVRISRAFARTEKGYNVKARVLKGTKTENTRYIPMDQYLYDLLEPLCRGRKPDDFVFVKKTGNPIDDSMFVKRIWKPLLRRMEIEPRDLYTCRHTFATRAVEQGLKPHEVAYLMGDSVETVLRRYFHNNRKPVSLPTPVSETKSDVERVSFVRKVA